MTSFFARALSILILSGVLFFLATFPVARFPLLIGACAYFALVLWRPNLWLLIVPLLLPLLYLTPWSGRFFFDEFDALVLLTVAAALWNRRFTPSVRRLSPGVRLLLITFLAVYIAAFLKGLLPLPALDANATASYYSSFNSFRSVKGLLWILLLYPAWTAEQQVNRLSAKQLLATGLAIGAFCVFLVVLWERNVFHTLLFWTNKYAPIQALLNFSTQYRITALFADMHTGGTAIDSYLLLVLPFTAFLFFRTKSPIMMGFWGITLFGTLYACMVTFSRGVYLGIAVAVFSAIIVVVLQSRQKLRPSIIAILIFAFVLLGVTGFLAFRSGGTVSLAYIVAAFFAAALLVQYGSNLKTEYLYAGYTLLTFLFVILATISIGARDYAFNSVPPLLLAFAFVLCGVIAGALAGKRLRLFLSAHQTGVILVIASILVSMLTPSLFGSRMDARFSSVEKDLLHRIEHWSSAVEIMDDDLPTLLFGQGLGRFPATYFWRRQDPKDVGGFSFQQEQGNQFLRYNGAKDVRLGQRISLQPDTDYVVSLDVRTKDDTALLYLRACHRQLIHPTEWNPMCINIKKAVDSTMGQWDRLEFPFNTNDIGSLNSWLRAPLVFTVSNRREYAFNLRPRTTLDIDNISVRSKNGTEKLNNGDFESGIDNWFGYYDFNHMPWHIKNLWVHVYFELGAVGLLLFMFLVISALVKTAKSAAHNGFAFTLFISLLGFLAVGSFGTLIDSPRIAVFFYLVLLLSLESKTGEPD